MTASATATQHRPTRTGRDHDSDETVAQSDTLGALANSLLGPPGRDRSLGQVLEIVVTGAVAALPQVERAGITMVESAGVVVSHTHTDGVVATLEGLQGELGEGPCHDCIREHVPVISDDLAATGPSRWPRFAPAALAEHVGAMCSVQLVAHGNSLAGALNLYATKPGTFDANCVASASLIASHAALAVHAARRIAELTKALDSRDVIGQAKGILMERFGLSDQQAFDKLVSSSQDTNIKLRDVADWLVNDTIRSPRPEASSPRANLDPGECSKPGRARATASQGQEA